MVIEMIFVGTELLLGDILNTNAQFLSKECAQLGLDVFHTSVVGDNEDRLLDSMQMALGRSDLVLLTGGLGSTSDDITKKVAIRCVGRETVQDEQNRKNVENWFQSTEAIQDNEIVYTFPSGTTVLPNDHGTAGGAFIPLTWDGKEKAIILLPGPPKEMRPMFETYLRPLLLEKTQRYIASREVRIGLLGEYQMHARFADQIFHSTQPTFAPYAKEDGALLRVTASGDNVLEVESCLESGLQQIREVFGSLIISDDGRSRAEVLFMLLKKNGEYLAVAESLTGGLLSAHLVDVAGISSVYQGGFIVYTDEMKQEQLDVKPELLERYTAVSEQACAAMLEGLERKTHADCCIATTGYAGPTGDQIGLVYLGVRYRGKTQIKEVHLHGDRESIRRRSTFMAIDLAVMMVRGNPWDE